MQDSLPLPVVDSIIIIIIISIKSFVFARWQHYSQQMFQITDCLEFIQFMLSLRDVLASACIPVSFSILMLLARLREGIHPACVKTCCGKCGFTRDVLPNLH